MGLASELGLGDARVEFMADYVLKSMKLKADRWLKMYNVDETKQMFMDFFEKPDLSTFVISGTSAGVLSASLTWPSNPKGKSCYFIKKSRDPVAKDTNLRNVILYGDFSGSPLDQLSAFVDEILVPLLSNERNHANWPSVVSKDVIQHILSLKGNVYVMSGLAKGKTLLPLPTGAERIHAILGDDSGDPPDRHFLHSIESVVIEWTHQIRDVLKQDSAQPLIDGLNPAPFVELEFWKNKASNLECIYDQLKNTKIKKMAELLERTKSSYFSAFKHIFRDVVEALKEAQDINMFLKPLRPHFDDFEQTEFVESIPLLAPVMHTICLIWANSDYYNTPGRIIVILQEICNMIINSATNYLEPGEIFKGEIEETIHKVKKANKVLNAFKATYEEHKCKLKKYFKPDSSSREWDFAPVLVFARYDNFLERAETLEELMECVLEFMKLEKVEFGGIKGKVLSQQIIRIFEEFNEQYKVFTDGHFDCLDLKDVASTSVSPRH